MTGVLSRGTLRAVTQSPYKFTHMTPVQAAVFDYLPHLSNPYDSKASSDEPEPPPRDILVKAKTGTGKTAAFAIPAIEQRLKTLDAFGEKALLDSGLPREKFDMAKALHVYARENAGALVISPTRELASQIAREISNLASHQRGFHVHLVVGGSRRHLQMREWMTKRRDIVVATPGRLCDILSEPEVRKAFETTPLVVLDEADTLLDMGFREDIEKIMSMMPSTPERQTFLFSATVSKAIQQISRQFLDPNHAFINCVTEESPVHAHVSQYHTVLPSPEDQLPHILRSLAHDQFTNPGRSKTVVFLPTTKMTQLFYTLLREAAKTTLPAGGRTNFYQIHSKRSQEQRTAASNAFRADSSGASVLVTSDVSARGVDYPGVTRVIQIGIPPTSDVYVHRVGRTGRAGTGGRGDLVLLPWESGFVKWELNKIPLKTVTVDEMKSHVEELAAEADKSKPRAPTKPSYLTTVESTNQRVQDVLTMIDEEAVKETLMAAVGYYLGKVGELRIAPQEIVRGLKNWTVGALGLAEPPHVSDRLLNLLGGRGKRDDEFGSRHSPYPGSMKKKTTPRWTDKGNQWSRNDRSARPGGHRSSRGFGEGDSRGRDGYRSSRGFGEENSRDRDGYRKQRRGFAN